jgi:hypothetical protein
MRHLFVDGQLPRVRAALPEYREIYDDTLNVEHLSTELAMGRNDIGALGLGWYAVEHFLGRPGRWCCSYGIAFLASPRAVRRARLTIAAAAVRPTTVILRTDRQERGAFTLEPGEWCDFEAFIPVTSQVVRVDILVSSPSRLEELDDNTLGHRTLGLMVNRLALTGWPDDPHQSGD